MLQCLPRPHARVGRKAHPSVGRVLHPGLRRNFCAAPKKKPPEGGFFPRARSLLGGAGGRRSSSGGRAGGSRRGAGSSGGGTSSGVGSRGSGGSRSRNDDGSRGRSGSRLFLLAASGEGGGGDQRSQNERFLHFRFPSGDRGDKFPESVPAAFVPLVTEWKKLERFPAQPTIIAVCKALLGDYPWEKELYRPSVVAGNAGVACRSHSARLSRRATR